MQSKPVITLTPAAIAHVKKIIAAKKEATTAFRFSVKEVGCSGLAYVPEVVAHAEPDDLAFEQDGLTIYVASEAVKQINGTQLDFVKQGINQHWVYRNPNVVSQCGCGESFKVEESQA